MSLDCFWAQYPTLIPTNQRNSKNHDNSIALRPFQRLMSDTEIRKSGEIKLTHFIHFWFKGLTLCRPFTSDPITWESIRQR